jgi:hypothetical protein
VEPRSCTGHASGHGGRLLWFVRLFPPPNSRYSDRDARSFKAEREETRRELGDVSKKAGIAKLEWEHQRKQLLEVIDGESCDLFNLNSTLK